MDLSIVVPLVNERESLPELVDQLHRVIGAMAVSYEVILVDDGSNDGSWEVIQGLAAADQRVRIPIRAGLRSCRTIPPKCPSCTA